jgi:hypothetical protein
MRCDEDGASSCIHDETAPALEILQKHAYQEIRTSVLRAVGKRLPKEIVDLVIEQTFFKEDMPTDPRVLGDGEEFWDPDLRPQYKCPHGVSYLGLTSH